MYALCLFCHGSLGHNPLIASFPVGSTLAFDGEKGRLWVVCPACQRWNLTPLEERWEAIEECERLFRGARLRVSTENVGMARLPEGLDLIRIGRPLRPEMAAWRYGRMLLQRRSRATETALWLGGTAAATTGALMFVPVLLPFVAVAGAVGMLGSMVENGTIERLWNGDTGRLSHDVVRRLRTEDGRPLALRGPLQSAQIRTDSRLPDGWELVLRTAPEEILGNENARVTFAQDPDAYRDHTYALRGPHALHAAALILRGANAWGASDRRVREATTELARVGDPARYFARAEEGRRRAGWGHESLWQMPPAVRLAMEMAAHESSERRAMLGDLEDLEKRWRQAEEVAAVADRLEVPAAVDRRLAGMKDRPRA